MRPGAGAAQSGILCAMGLLLTDLRADFADHQAAAAGGSLAQAGEESLRRLGRPRRGVVRPRRDHPDARQLTRTVDMRYAGQNYELSVPLPDGPVTATSLEHLAEGFEEAHRHATASSRWRGVQIVTLRVEAAGLVKKATLKSTPRGPGRLVRHHRQARRVVPRPATSCRPRSMTANC